MKRRLAALGSWFGDDRIAWVLLQELAKAYRRPPDLEYVSCDRSGLEWLHGEIPGQLILVDAVCSGVRPGHVHRFVYPDADLVQTVGGYSSHGLPLDRSLDLARSLGRLPRQVLFWGVEIDPGSRSEQLSAALVARVPDLTRMLARELDLPLAA